jgi:hypothetical protein
MDDDFVVLIVCGMDNCVAFVTQGLVDNTATGHFQKDDLRGFTGHEQLPRHNIIVMSMDDDFVVLIVCGMDNCVAQGLVDNTATGHFQKDDLRGFTGHEQLPRHSVALMTIMTAATASCHQCPVGSVYLRGLFLT